MNQVQEARQCAAQAGALGSDSVAGLLHSVADRDKLADLLDLAPVIQLPQNMAPLQDRSGLGGEPIEEFRSLRTRLNHLQGKQALRSVVITSPSTSEGKSFVATNLAMAEAQLAGNLTLLCDFDLRRPAIHHFFRTDRAPGITDCLLGLVPLQLALRRIEGTNLCILPAGQEVPNPLELLNLVEVKSMLARLRARFHWLILDTPPLLAGADASLLSTYCDGTILVARMGATTPGSLSQGLESLCADNVVGIVANGVPEGERYRNSRYYRSDTPFSAPIQQA